MNRKFKITVKEYPLRLPNLDINVCEDLNFVVNTNNIVEEVELKTWFSDNKSKVELVEIKEKPESTFLAYLKSVKFVECERWDNEIEADLKSHFSLVLADEFLKAYEKIGTYIDSSLTEEEHQNSIKYFEQTVDQVVNNCLCCVKDFNNIITEEIPKIIPKIIEAVKTSITKMSKMRESKTSQLARKYLLEILESDVSPERKQDMVSEVCALAKKEAGLE